MRTHLGCTGSVELGCLAEDTQKRLERIPATWLEYVPETSALVVRHVRPDDAPPLRELAGELVDFLQAVSEPEREQVPGGALYYQDEATGQYVRLLVSEGCQLTLAWACPDYSDARWERFQNQRLALVFEPYQRLNGSASFEGGERAADSLRRVLEETTGDYSDGDFNISASGPRIELSLRHVNADAISIVNALRYLATNDTLLGEIDVSSFRTGDLEDYCRFSFRGDEIWFARPILWSDAPEDSSRLSGVGRP